MKKIILSVALVTVWLSSCLAQSQLQREIAESHEQYFKAFAKGDASLLAWHYAESPWIMPAEAPAMCGVDAVSDFYEHMHSRGVRDGRLITTDIFGDEKEFVTEIGLFQFSDGNKRLIENGTFMILWKKTDRGWKMFRNSFNQ